MNKLFFIQTPPLTVNSMYRGRRFLTKDGEKAKMTMGAEIRRQWGATHPVDGAVCLEVTFYYPTTRNDIDGGLKALLDAFTGIVYHDDKQVEELHVIKRVSKENPRVEVTVRHLCTG